MSFDFKKRQSKLDHKNSNKHEYLPQDFLFLNESTSENILMSDNQEVHVFYSLKHSNSNNPTIVFIQGLGPEIYSWTELWDQLFIDHNLVIIDTREKPSINLKKNKLCTVPRIALDIVEVLHYLKIESKKTAFIASSFGVYFVAHCVAQKWIDPIACFFIGPSVQPIYPKIKTKLGLILPTFLLEKVVKKIVLIYVKGKFEEGYQRNLYTERIAALDVKRWKYCSKMRFWDATEDYKKIACPAVIFTAGVDRYHSNESAIKVKNLVKNGVIEPIPYYDYMRIKPGVIEFADRIKKLITIFTDASKKNSTVVS